MTAENDIALVTGGAGGIGRIAVVWLVKHGYRGAVLD